jgi:hypothetical protein
MLRILRAFTWMRWRVLLNSFERTGARDTLERLSLAVDQIGPIVALLLLMPSLLGMSVLSAFAGYALASGPQRPLTFEVLRYLTLAVSGLAIVGPIVLPLMERANPVRLMLLPIPRTTLYVAQASGAVADPWTLLVLPSVLFLPLGLAAGGALQAAALSLAAGLLFLAVIVGLSTLTACALQLLVRDRRRGELVALAFILLLPLVGVLTNLLDQSVLRRSRHATRPAPIERSSGPGLADRLARRAFALMPSEHYVGATRAGAEGRLAASATALLALGATAALLHGCALLVFEQLLAFPGSAAPRRSGGKGTARARRVPGLSRAAGAVAIAQIRLVLRTPRGRSTLLSPLLVFIVLAVSLRSGATSLGVIPRSGVGLAAFGAFFSVMAILPFAMNQFAIDGAGLTLELLSPLSDEELIDGKSVASAVLAGVPALLCFLAAVFLFPGGSVAHWISVPLAAASIYLLVAPVTAAASATFPRAVDLNSVGRASTAHGLAGLIGVGSVVLSGLPPAGMALLANAWLKRPELTPVMLLIWCALTLGINRLLLRPVSALLARRRENLGLVAR